MPGSSSSKLVIVGAIVANFGIAVAKFVAAAITGSSAMLAEGIHSVVDTGNGLLMLLGVRMSKRPPSEMHPYGHGPDLYFWAMIVAVMIFGVGGGVTIYEGILHVRNPAPTHDPTWNYVVLGIALVLEGASWTIAVREFFRTKGTRGVWEGIRRSKDPTHFTVLLEDSAAIAGLVVAAVAVWLGDRLQQPWIDGVASILIGLILCAVAGMIIHETRGLLLGEAADPEVVESIQRIVEQDVAITGARRPLTLHFAPDQILLNLELQFRPELKATELERAIDRIERAIRERHPNVRHIFVEAESIRGDR